MTQWIMPFGGASLIRDVEVYIKRCVADRRCGSVYKGDASLIRDVEVYIKRCVADRRCGSVCKRGVS